MRNWKKVVGNILLIGALICFVLFMKTNNHDLKSTLAMCYGFGIIGGGALRLGDFFKWRGQQFQKGINEERNKTGKFCSKCGSALNENSQFCSNCGSKVE